MINDKRVLAVIPARGGSKRCPGKNIRDFRGKPLIAWSIEAARNSRYIDWYFLSTDDSEIASVGFNYACPLVKRPEGLSTDLASSEDVIRYMLSFYPADLVVLLQPTSPLRTHEDIDRSIELAQFGEACISYREDGTKNGAVYVASREWIFKNNFSNPETMRYVMPNERSLDIDYIEQFHAA